MDKHIFIIRFWSEQDETEPAHAELRGTIQHVPSGDKYPLNNFDALLTCITSYLPDLPDPKRPLLLTATATSSKQG